MGEKKLRVSDPERSIQVDDKIFSTSFILDSDTVIIVNPWMNLEIITLKKI